MRNALSAEGTKLRGLAGTGWLLLAFVTLTIAGSATAAGATTCRAPGCGYDPVRISLTGVRIGQAVVGILAVVTISEEYDTGLIRTTFAALPHRTTVLAAKAVVVGTLTMATGTVAVSGCLLVGRLILPVRGFTAAHGYSGLSLTDGPTLRAAVSSVCYLTLVASLSLGLAALIRHSGASIGAILGLLYVFPAMIVVLPDPVWQRRLWQISPVNAGLATQATTSLNDPPTGLHAGLGVLAAWAAAALLSGAIRLRVGDA